MKRQNIIAAMAIGAISLISMSGRTDTSSQARSVARDIQYGQYDANRLDIYSPPAPGSHPAVLFIHAGGWWNGDKGYISQDEVEYFLSRGIAFISINYRNLNDAKRDNVFPPVMAPLQDTRAALQFVQKNAEKFGISPDRMAIYGESAGGFNALWLGILMSDQSFKRQDSFPLLAIGAIDAQTSIDPVEMCDWIGPSINYGGHAFGLPEGDFPQFLANREKFITTISEISPSYRVSNLSPPIFLYYEFSIIGAPTDHMGLVHSPNFGARFAEVASRRGARVTFEEGGKRDTSKRKHLLEFLAAQLADRVQSP